PARPLAPWIQPTPAPHLARERGPLPPPPLEHPRLAGAARPRPFAVCCLPLAVRAKRALCFLLFAFCCLLSAICCAREARPGARYRITKLFRCTASAPYACPSTAAIRSDRTPRIAVSSRSS